MRWRTILSKQRQLDADDGTRVVDSAPSTRSKASIRVGISASASQDLGHLPARQLPGCGGWRGSRRQKERLAAEKGGAAGKLRRLGAAGVKGGGSGSASKR